MSSNCAWTQVIVDGTVAERSKQRPEFAAELQAMLWAARNGVGIPSSIGRGYIIEFGGPRLMFGLSIVPMAVVLLPPLLGWIEKRPRARVAAAAHRACTECDRAVARRGTTRSSGPWPPPLS